MILMTFNVGLFSAFCFDWGVSRSFNDFLLLFDKGEYNISFSYFLTCGVPIHDRLAIDQLYSTMGFRDSIQISQSMTCIR